MMCGVCPALGPRARRWAGLLIACAPLWAQAQALPDAGSVLRDAQRAQPAAPPPGLPPAPAAAAPRAPDDTRFQVSRFELQGVTLLPLAELQALLKPWREREVVFADLQDATRAIAERYRERGWYASAQLPPQDVVDGVVRVQVSEALFGGLRIDDSAALPISRERIERTFGQQQQAGEPLSLTRMNRALGLLNDLPGVRAKAALDAGAQAQATDVLLGFEPRPPWSGSSLLDNQGARSTGAYRINSSLNLDNPRGMGDQAQANVMASEGVRYLRLAYSLPLGYSGLRVGVNASKLLYRVIEGPGAATQAEGSAGTRGLTISQPWWRTGTANANLGLSHTEADYTNRALGQTSSTKTGRTTSLTLSGDLYDTWLGGASNLWSLTATHGQMAELSFSNASSPQPTRSHNQYDKLSANLARLQRISETHSLWLSWTSQHAFRPLDSSEKFTLGGAQAVRAYPGTEGTGDQGWLLTLESRHNLRSDVQLSAFYDTGRVTVSQNIQRAAPERGINHYALSGAGLSLRYTHSGSTFATLTWARRLGSNPLANASTGKDTDGTRVLNRFWLTVSSLF